MKERFIFGFELILNCMNVGDIIDFVPSIIFFSLGDVLVSLFKSMFLLFHKGWFNQLMKVYIKSSMFARAYVIGLSRILTYIYIYI